MKKTIFIRVFLLQTCFTTIMYSAGNKPGPIIDQKLFDELEPIIKQVLFEDNLDEQGNTYLHRAETAEMARHLLKKGLSVHALNALNQTPLHVAQNPDVIQVLIDAGADVNAIDSYGRTPIFYAS